ncbi:MAG: hypothetical protein H6727_18695 [Myxococcales bacterium]|nr:hypothetical protein [Myxococcales bacterium]
MRDVMVWLGLRHLRWICFFAAFAWFSNPSFAGPWSQAPGHFYVKANQTFMFGRESVGLNGELGGGDFFGASTSLYGEVGIFYGLQAQFFLPYTVFRVTRSPEEFYQLDSFVDSIVGLQWTPPFLYKALGFPIALRFNTKIPLYDQYPLLENDVTKNIVSRVPIIGEGQLDFTLWLSAGGSIPRTDLYVFAEAGYRFRSEIFVDQRIKGLNAEFLDSFVFNAQVGYNIARRVLVMLNTSGVIPLGESPLTKGFVGIGLGLYVPVWRGLAIEANVDHMLWYKSAPPVTSFGVGVSYKY